MDLFILHPPFSASAARDNGRLTELVMPQPVESAPGTGNSLHVKVVRSENGYIPDTNDDYMAGKLGAWIVDGDKRCHYYTGS